MAAGGRRNGSVIIILALLLIVGMGAIFFLFKDQLLGTSKPQAAAATPTPAQKMVNIVITTQFVNRGTKLTDGVLTTVPYPEKDLVQGTFYTDVSQVVGKQAKYDLEARLPLTSSLIAETGNGSSPAFQIPKGMVAVSIPISRLTAVSYAPQEGDHVNVIVSIMLTDVDANFQSRLPNNTALVVGPQPATEEKPGTLSVTINSSGDPSAQGRVELDGTLGQAVYVVPSEVQRPRPVSQTLIQDAIVLHVGSFLDVDTTNEPNPSASTRGTAQPTAEPSRGGDAKATATPSAPKAPADMTLIVSPQDAVTLNYLMLVDAKLSLVLRAAGDSDKPGTEAVTLQFLMDQYSIPNPAKLPYALEPRVDDLEFPKLVYPTATPAPK